MSNPTDTNQASEDKLFDTKAWKDGFQSGYDQVINEILYWLAETKRKTIPSKWVTSRQTDMHSKQHEKLTALIRTEKLKLLAEVRERVIEQAKPDKRKATSWQQGIEVAAYEDAVRVYEYKMNEQLTKLEAEL